MKLLLRRNQRGGLLGGQVFMLEVRAQLSDQERESVGKMGLGNTLLYQRLDERQAPEGFLAVGAFYAKQVEIRVRDLHEGIQYECKDIVEMLSVEHEIKQAARSFVAVLAAAAKFGGEEVLEIEA
jgi:hypothetical protein